ncbi:MAG: glycosyltransferase [Candidatus Bathyarchaeota archaeon]|nr:glycosyltransferase [Candidatus Bathyarchaeota archaeon]
MNRNNLKCSVILPTYNRYYSIRYAIQSVLRQTYKNWELMSGRLFATAGL